MTQSTTKKKTLTESMERLATAMHRHELYIVLESMPNGKFYCLINKQYSAYKEIDAGCREYNSLEEAINDSLDRLEYLDRKHKIKVLDKQEPR